jgi:hypothetical protein
METTLVVIEGQIFDSSAALGVDGCASVPTQLVFAPLPLGRVVLARSV